MKCVRAKLRFSWVRHLGTIYSIGMGLKIEVVGKIWVKGVRGQGGEVELYRLDTSYM